jgi:ATPase family associated with various cellular activities (AAA)
MRFFKASPSRRIDYRIENALGARQKKQLIVHTAELPAYRFVDLFNAVGALFAERDGIDRIETQQHEMLNQIIHDAPTRWEDRSVRLSPKVVWQTGPDETAYLPVDCFWICPSRSPDACFVVRLKFDEFAQKAKLEVACRETDAGKAALERIQDHSRRHSIYRNHTLQLAYEAGKRDEYGDIEQPERFQVMFSPAEPVTDEDIVLAEDQLKVLQRNVIDLHTRREVLLANGVPSRRGILLHGPPGTGKTFACRYLCHKLPGVTRLFVTGTSLLNVNAVFSFARLLQPSVVFFEDVDLIFASREINLYSSALGDLLDQMDGLRAHENISVVFTTNAIDRLEAAIKDRPGRISQCIYMGAPAAEQRRRFLGHQLRRHDAKAVDLERLVAETDGATQAFLKEWVHRAVQIACERLDGADENARLHDADFLAALDEMRRFLDGSDGRIIGFVGRG